MASERTPPSAPDPPVELPEGRIVRVAGLGELFVRDTGGSGPPVLLLALASVSGRAAEAAA